MYFNFFLISVLWLCFLVSVFLTGTTAIALEPSFVSLRQEQALNEKHSIYFNGRTYYFGYGDESKNEYFVEGEGVNGWTSLVGIFIFPDYKKPSDVANALFQSFLDQRVPVQKAIHKSNKEAMLTFMIENKGILELNIWRFYKDADTSQIIGVQFAKSVKKPRTNVEGDSLKKEGTSLSDQLLSLKKEDFIP